MAVKLDISVLLEAVGAEECTQTLADHGVVTIEQIAALTGERLKEWGISSYASRVQIATGIQKAKELLSSRDDVVQQELLNLALYNACVRGDAPRVEKLLSLGAAVNYHNDAYLRWTPLHVSSKHGHTPVVSLLLSQEGVDVNIHDVNGETPLHCGAWNGHLNTCKLLLAAKAHVDVVNGFGQTPFHFAAYRDHLQVVKFLIQNGASSTQCNDRGESALDYARIDNRTDLIAYLEKLEHTAEDVPSQGQASPPPHGVTGTQNRNIVKQHIEQQGSLPVRSLKCFLIGPSCVGKTSARRRLTGEIDHISQNEVVPSTGIDAPLTVRLYHPTEQSSVLLSEGWHSQGLEEQCLTVCSHVLNSPNQPLLSCSSSNAEPSIVTASPEAVRRSTKPLSKLTNLFKRAWKTLGRRPVTATTSDEVLAARGEVSDKLDATAARDELTTALTTLVRADDWKSIRDFLKEVQTLTLLHIVDIGGQPEFHEILPLLLHGLALNLIFLNVTQDLDSLYTVIYRDGSGANTLQYQSEFTIREIIQRALCTISSLQTSETNKPAAILIGTYLDRTNKRGVLDLDNSIQESFKNADFMKTDVLCSVNKQGEEKRYIHPLDNISGDPSEIDELRRLISTIVHDRFTPEDVPTAALLLHLILRMKFDCSPGWCTLEQCIKIAESCGISREDLLREGGILQYLHDKFGTILYYRNLTKLSQRVIVNTNVIMGPPARLFIVAFGAIKTEQQTAEHIRATGEISDRLMNKVCSSNTDDAEQSADDIPTNEIVELLASRCILYKNARSAGKQAVYFMPALLYPDHNVAKESNDPTLLANLPYPPIVFIPCVGDVPLGQFPATAVNLSKEWDLDEAERYRNRIRFYARCKNKRLLHVELRTLATHLELRVLPQPSINTCLMVESLQKFLKQFAEVSSLYPHTRRVEWSVGFYCPHALQSGRQPHIAVCSSMDNPHEMVCSVRDCRAGLISLDDKHRSWFVEMPAITTTVPNTPPHTQGVGYVTTPSTQEPVKQGEQAGQDHQSGDPLSRAPTMRDLLNKVASKALDKWERIGLSLDIELHYLKSFSRQQQQDPILCYSEVFTVWRKKADPPFTWATIVDTLKDPIVGEMKLAAEIEEWLTTPR